MRDPRSIAGLSSLRVRLLLLILLALVPALGLILYTAVEQRQVAIREAQRDALALAQSVAHEQRRVLISTRDLLRALAELPVVRSPEANACRELFTQLLRDHPLYSNLGVVGPDGRLRCSGMFARVGVDLADRAYFRRAVETREFAVGDYQVGRVTGRPSINAAYPVLTSRGAVEGVVFAALDLGWLSRLVAEARLPTGTSFTMVDGTGTVIVRSPDPQHWVGRSFPDVPAVTIVRAGAAGVAEATGLDGVPRLLGFTPLLNGGGAGDLFVGIGIPKSVAVAATNQLLVRNLLALGVVGMATLLVAWVGSNALVLRRIHALVQAARRLANGDLSARIGSTDRGELGRLAETFDEMAGALSARQADLQRAAESLRETNETLRALIHASPLAIVALDRDGNVQMWNRTAERLFGWSEAEVIGRPNPIVPPDPDAESRGHSARAWQGEILTDIETHRLARDGTVIDVSISWAPVYDVNVAVSNVLVLYTDIRERRRAEAEVARQREALHQAEKMAALGRLAAGVAHELRNPLTVLDGRFQLLRAQIDAGRPVDLLSLADQLNRLEHAATRMKSIMAGLSSYSRPAKAQAVLLNVGELLSGLHELVAHHARTANVSIVVDAPIALPPVRGDRSEMTQVLVNLATNGIEAMGTAGGTLTLRAGASPSDNGARVVVEVCDTGPGIPAETLELIWQPFYTTKPEGTGLGLSIVRGLVEKQPGATIAVESAPGAGTTFRITMPGASAPSPAGD